MEHLCQIRDLYRAISDFEESFQHEHGVSLNEAMLLCTLSRQGACCSGQLAQDLGLTASNSSKVIASTEKKGLTLRALCTQDKRRMIIELSDKGREKLTAIKQEDTQMAEFLSKIRQLL